MPWEERAGRRYYYRKVRRGGRVFSVYEGAELAGVLAEQQDASGRETKARAREKLRREIAHQDLIDAKINRAWQIASALASEALEAAGYHQYKRQWRLKRDAKTG